MNTLAIIQARTGSTRFPNKVLMPLGWKPILQHVVRRTERFCANVIVVTSNLPEDDIIAWWCKEWGVQCCREGNEPGQVMQWYINAIVELATNVNYIFRVCGDSPFISYEMGDQLKAFTSTNPGYSYYSFATAKGVPSILTYYGIFPELFTYEALLRAHYKYNNPEYMEHVTNVFYQNPDEFYLYYTQMPSYVEMLVFQASVDSPADLERVQLIYKSMYGAGANIEEICAIIEDNPELQCKERVKHYDWMEERK